MASTRHLRSENILIGYPFRALSSWPRVVSLIYDPESFFPFRALSPWPGVIHFIYDLESFLAFIALSSWPRVIYPIFDPESFIQFPTQSRLSYFFTQRRPSCPWPRVIRLIHDFESSFSSFSIFVLPVTYLSVFIIISPHELFHSCRYRPMFRPLLSSCAKTKYLVLL